MAAHNLIKWIVRKRKDNQFLIIAADGGMFLVAADGELLDVFNNKPDPIATIRATRKDGALVDLDTLPAPVVEYLDSLNMLARFPKCFSMLSRIVSGGVKIDSFDKREKQALNELIRHGLIKKSKTNYLIQ